MRFEWYAREIPALVRRRQLYRHRALLDESTGAAFVLLAQGPPRAWHLSLDAAVQGIASGLEEGLREAEPLLARAATELRTLASSLVEGEPIQAHGVAMILKDRKLDLATSGSCRAYLHREGDHRRLTPSTDSKGLLNAFTFSSTSEELSLGDVVIAGPSHVFGVTGVAQMARLLQDTKRLTSRILVRGLLSTQEIEQTGGAVVGLRAV